VTPHPSSLPLGPPSLVGGRRGPDAARQATMSNFFKPIGNLIDSVRSDIKFHGACRARDRASGRPA